MNNDAPNSEVQNLKNGHAFKVFIDPLQGYVFELSVHSNDSVSSVKMKIEELKGIPANQQQLLFNFKELENTATLEELSISDQTTLQLVLSLRSGPISSLRKIIPAIGNTLLKDLIIHNRKEIGSLQPGARLSIVLFRDGSKVKMFRMLEKIDSAASMDSFIGSSTTISDSCKELILKNQRSKCVEDRKIVQKVKLIKAKLLEQKNSRKKAGVSNENELPFMNQILNENLAPAKKKLPPLSSTLAIKEESSPRTKVEFSQVPVLPNIGPNTLPSRHASQASGVNKLAAGSGLDKLSMSDLKTGDVLQTCELKETVSSANKKKNNLVAQRANLYPETSTRKEDSRINLQLKSPAMLKSEKNLINNLVVDQDAIRKLPLSEDRKNSSLGEHLKSGFFSSRNPVSNIEMEDFVPAKKLLSAAPVEKRSKNRCSECRKKLTISNMYECRCGLLLCSTHRYSEAHSCSFDYKTEGRSFIEKVNPPIIAPKLPKI